MADRLGKRVAAYIPLPMSNFRFWRRFGATGLLLALALLPSRLCAASPAAEPGTSGFGVCGALTTDPGLAAIWPAASGVRPGKTVLDSDKGFGCRFTPAGKPGGSDMLLEARLTRPAATGTGTAVDRWRVPARKGEPAAIIYAFYPPGRATPGEWSLEVYDGGEKLAATTFTVTGAAVRGAVTPAAPEEAMPDAPPPPASDAPPRDPAPADAAATPPPEAAPQKPQPPVTPATPPAPKPASARTGTKKPPRPATAQTATTPKNAPATSPAPRTTGFYALQTGLFTDASNADKQAASIRGRGIPACVAVENGGKGRRYRVLAGRYGDKRAAVASRGEVGRAAGVRPLLFAVPAAQAGALRCH